MRTWSFPWLCTVASLAPSAFTRLDTTATAEARSSCVTALPSGLLAVIVTETPPWMSRPWVIFSLSGQNPITHATRIASSTTSVLA